MTLNRDISMQLSQSWAPAFQLRTSECLPAFHVREVCSTDSFLDVSQFICTVRMGDVETPQNLFFF